MRARDDGGAALAFVILLMLALLALAHGALVASLSELAGSRAAVRDLRLRGAARGALARTLAVPRAAATDGMGEWESRDFALDSVGDLETSGLLVRLGAESWLVAGEARNPLGAGARSARLAWSLDPLSRVTALDAVVSVGPSAPVSLGGSADATRPTAVEPPMPADACNPWLGALDAHYATAPLALVSAFADSAAEPALGLLDLGALLSSAPVLVAGSGTPGPAEALGACVDDAPWGWGDPDRPWAPCGERLPMRGAAGDLLVSGGVGQGVLVVDGDLTLRDGARYYGLVIASGALGVEGGSTLVGMALAAGGVTLAPGASLEGSACWAVRALAAQRDVLARLTPVAGAGPMGPF